jgi:phosphohistidine swiveling domain-containing protein
MSDESYKKTFYGHQFIALGSASLAENKDVIDAALATITPPLSVPINETRLALGGAALIVEWASLPSSADVAAVTDKIPTIVGVETTSAPFEFNSFAVSTSTSNTHGMKIDQTTPPLDAGTYQVIWNSSLRMQAVAANTGVEGKIRITRSDGAFVEQDDAWNLANRHAFNGALTFTLLAGQTIRVQLSHARLGASGTAEMSGARVTIDQIARPGD